MSGNFIEEKMRLGAPPWPTLDPFLFCVHHNDDYPAGNDALGPVDSLDGRQIGMDFGGKDGWSMYHGDVVPGFPRHPHRGFETVTLARRGRIDHSDSLGAKARFGDGDVQWMTAGRGIVHSEMFPLLKRDGRNPTELFQIWLNLPSKSKLVAPHFKMLWGETVPKLEIHDGQGHAANVTVISGSFGDSDHPPAPPPESWASDPANEVCIWNIVLEESATITLPAASSAGINRMLYFFAGRRLEIGEEELSPGTGAKLRADLPTPLRAADGAAEILILQGKPIAEPVAHYGPFVMNSRAELQQAMIDYQRDGFGGWPWKRDDPVHERDASRFAIHADGQREEP
jgi:redox-sensitive bicupin YhaK (pirin superfamily)